VRVERVYATTLVLGDSRASAIIMISQVIEATPSHQS